MGKGSPDPNGSIAAQSPLILHVDDDEANRYAITRSLQKAGYRIIEAASGHEALEKMAEQPDLVILDVRLPDINGFEVCQIIKSRPATTGTPVLHLSASYVRSEDRAHGLESGADAYLIRPVEPVELIATVKALLRQRHAEERLKQANTSLEQTNIAVKTANDSLRRSEARYRSLVSATTAIVWTADPSGAFVTPQHSWEAFTGQTWEQHRGMGWAQAIHPEDRERVLADWTRAISESGVYRSQGRLWHGASRQYHHFDMRGVPLFEPDGRLHEWIGMVDDVEERHQLLERERRARLEAEQANRLKDEFLATLSHELRTPLNAITGWASLLSAGNATQEDLDEGLQAIARNARVQAQLIEDLLDVSRIISGKLRMEVQEVELASVCEAALDSVYPAAEAKGVQLARILETRGTTVLGDPSRLQQVVWNLLSNAVKFTPGGGRVSLAIRAEPTHVEIAVSDTGEGINPEFIPHVFERFRQADASSRRQKGGLGLGLAIVRHLVELHGGTVEGQSQGKGCGATFTVKLPLISAGRRFTTEPSAVDAVHAAPSTGAIPNLAGLHTLVVEDEIDSRRLLQRLLEARHIAVVAVGNVRDAMQAIRSQPFDVLVSDIGLPGSDGYDLIERIRALPAEQGGQIPAIALTAFARPEDAERALKSGFQVHLPKPIDEGTLLHAISRMVGRHAVPGATGQNPAPRL